MPSDVALALNGLRYQTYSPEKQDTIVLTIHDGSGGATGKGCIANKHFTSDSRRDSCLVSTCSVQVQRRVA